MAQGLTLDQLKAMGAKPAGGLTLDQLKATQPQPDHLNGFDVLANAPDTKAAQAWAPATGTESPLAVTGKVLANIVPSAVNFGVNTVKSVANIPGELAAIPGQFAALAHESGGVGPALKAFAREVPGATYKSLVPQFLQHTVAGKFDKAAATIENDPVGQILPLVMLARGVAEATGKTAEFDHAISTMAKPVTVPAAAASRAAGSVLSQLLGASTGAGASSIKVATEGTPEFTAAMRGQLTPDEIVQDVHDAVQNIKNARGDAYVEQLKKIGEDTTTHDISPVIETVQSNLKKFGIRVNEDGSLDFSRSSIANNGSARADVQGVFDTVKNWGSQAGDRTGVGLDTLKKQLTDFYSPSGQARAFVQSVKGAVTDILNNQVPGYADMTKSYAKTSELLDDIRSATGIGGTAKADTVFTKLTQAMRADKDFRLQVLRQIETTGGEAKLMDKIAGFNLSSAIPRGLVGKGTDIGAAFSALLGHFNPAFVPVLLSTSPRLVGEFVRALGLTAQQSTKVINAVNTLAPIAPYLSPSATQQSNQSQAQTQPVPQ